MEQKWRVGQECEAVWLEDNVFYLARIDEIKRDGTIVVTFTEYGNSQDCTPDLLRPLSGYEEPVKEEPPKKVVASAKNTSTSTKTTTAQPKMTNTTPAKNSNTSSTKTSSTTTSSTGAKNITTSTPKNSTTATSVAKTSATTTKASTTKTQASTAKESPAKTENGTGENGAETKKASSEEKLLMLTQQVSRDCEKIVSSTNRQEDAIRLKRIAGALSKEVAYAAKLGHQDIAEQLKADLKALIQATRDKLKGDNEFAALQLAVENLNNSQRRLLESKKSGSSAKAKEQAKEAAVKIQPRAVAPKEEPRKVEPKKEEPKLQTKSAATVSVTKPKESTQPTASPAKEKEPLAEAKKAATTKLVKKVAPAKTATTQGNIAPTPEPIKKDPIKKEVVSRKEEPKRGTEPVKPVEAKKEPERKEQPETRESHNKAIKQQNYATLRPNNLVKLAQEEKGTRRHSMEVEKKNSRGSSSQVSFASQSGSLRIKKGTIGANPEITTKVEVKESNSGMTLESFSPDTSVWIYLGGDDPWVKAVVTCVGSTRVEVELEESGEKLELEASKVYIRNPELLLAGIEDLTKLSYMHEPALLYTLATRYNDDKIYTYTGSTLIAVNPYKKLPIYGKSFIDAYCGQKLGNLSPHAYAIAEDAYRQMLDFSKSQSVLVR